MYHIPMKEITHTCVCCNVKGDSMLIFLGVSNSSIPILWLVSWGNHSYVLRNI